MLFTIRFSVVLFRLMVHIKAKVMSLLMSLYITAFLMNTSVIQTDSIKKNPLAVINYEQDLKLVAKEVGEIKGVKVMYFPKVTKQLGEKIKVDLDIHFSPGDFLLNNETKETLIKFSNIISKNQGIEITLTGHTDNISTLELNKFLSINRAQTVADFLMAQKVNRLQFKEITGKNYSEPVSNNSTAAGRFANRRVEVYLSVKVKENKSEVSPKVSREIIKSKVVPLDLKKVLEKVIKKSAKSNEVEIEIDGLLVDDTKTKAGKDFYDLFYNEWEAPVDAKNYTITVSEKPFRLTSTLIVISINEDIVYQAILQPRQDLVEAQAVEGIGITQDYLANYEEITKQLNGDDMAGTGIY